MSKVSVIVPVYNVENYIAKCLESIKNQTLKDFECLIINDGTKDNSVDIAKKTIGSDERFKIIHKENGGLSDARNFGLSKATGEYVFFLDSDDYIVETLLEDTYAMAKKHDSDIVCFDLLYVYDDGRTSLSSGGNFEVTNYKENKELLFINNSANNKIYRREFMKDKEFIKGMWYEDLAVIPIWLTQANNVSYVNKPLYCYLQREGSISHSADPRIFDIYKAIDNIKTNLNLNSEDVNKLYLNNCLVMTTLRIKEIDDKKMRMSFFRHNVELLDLNYKTWYLRSLKANYSTKQKIIFTLLKFRFISLVDWFYNH